VEKKVQGFPQNFYEKQKKNKNQNQKQTDRLGHPNNNH
jgi:hypothetical protein